MPLVLPGFFMDNLWFVFLVGSAVAFPLAWVADSVFAERGFGFMGNYIFLITGALGGAAWMMLYTGSATRVMDAPQYPFFAAVAGSFVVLFLAATVKRFLPD
ncbi:MAG: hypothetical protein KI785_08165 [Devosiaceae bacterium]|nr:hypothetical protein [Devosiaceae bacterium MH13]